MNFTILFDEPHEAVWFKKLNPSLAGAAEVPISEARAMQHVSGVLGYDRPDIVLLENDTPILVVEETVEVPSGHNVGQRFARLAAAAEHNVPCLYFGPYAARKHGGETAGPRYMNLRLFGALDAMVRVTGTAVTTINWPVDKKYEVRRDNDKDADVREYVATLLDMYRNNGTKKLNASMLKSEIHQRMLKERDAFIRTLKRQTQYDLPPESVQILTDETFRAAFKFDLGTAGIAHKEAVVYNVGMKNIRSDPYTGMAMLYRYLYIIEHANRSLVLWFPNVSKKAWAAAAKNGARKDVRLFRHSADAILFSDGLVPKESL